MDSVSLLNPSKFSIRKHVFLVAFLVSFCFQIVSWNAFKPMDFDLWSNQARYFSEDDEKQFDFLAAYAHPGGTLIVANLVAHNLFGLPYTGRAFTYVVSALDALVIAFISLIFFRLRPKTYLWIFSMLTLSLHRIYFNTTPPSALSALLALLLVLITLYIYENRKNNKNIALIAWSTVSGLLVATRADVGLFYSFFMSLILVTAVGVKQYFRLFFIAVGVFFAFDPYMWFMPIQHAKDLVYKLTYHYEEFHMEHLNLVELMDWLWIPAVSIILYLISFFNKKLDKANPNKFFFGVVIIATIVHLGIIVTSSYQAVRYLTPIVLIWDSLLLLFIFSSSDKRLYRKQIVFGCLLVGYHIGFLADYFLAN